jgi:hypothetical protein
MTLNQSLETINTNWRELDEPARIALVELQGQIRDSIEINCIATRLYRAAHKLPFVDADEDRCFMEVAYETLTKVLLAGGQAEVKLEPRAEVPRPTGTSGRTQRRRAILAGVASPRG